MLVLFRPVTLAHRCLLQAERGAPLLQLSPAHLEPVRQIKQAIQAAAAAAPRISVGNDHCETCKVGCSHCPRRISPLCWVQVLHAWQLVSAAVSGQLSSSHNALMRKSSEACCAVNCMPSLCMSVCAQVVVQEMRTVVADPKLQAQMVDYAKQACSVFPSYQPTCEADVEQYAPMAFGMIMAYLQPEQVRTLQLCALGAMVWLLFCVVAAQACAAGHKPDVHKAWVFGVLCSLPKVTLAWDAWRGVFGRVLTWWAPWS